MTLTYGRAIEIIDPDGHGAGATDEELDEACRMACHAIRAVRDWERSELGDQPPVPGRIGYDRCVDLLASGCRMPGVAHTSEEMDEACAVAMGAMRMVARWDESGCEDGDCPPPCDADVPPCAAATA